MDRLHDARARLANALPLAAAVAIEEDAAKPQASADELPSELEADRLSAAGPPGDDLLLRNGTILTGTGETLPHHDLFIRDGKIAAIAPELPDQDGVTAIDVSGWFVTPGIIDTHSHIMISGDVNESSQSVVPEVRVKDVVRSDDEREYRALVSGVPDARALDRLSKGVVLDGRRTAPAVVRLAPVDRGATSAVLYLTIREGRNRQVRRMCEAVGHPVQRLTRTRIGPLRDDRLRAGVEAASWTRACLKL